MASPFVQGANATAGQSSTGGATNTYSIAFTTQNTTAGNMLCVAFRANSSGTTVNGVADNQGNGAYTVLGPYTNATTSLWFAFALKTKGGTKASITITFAGTSVVGGIAPVIAEYTGVDSYRGTDGGNTGTGDNPVSGNLTTNIGDLIIGFCQDTAGMTTFAAGASYTLRESSVVTVNTFCAIEEQGNGVLGGGVTTVGFTSATSTTWSAGAVAFYKAPNALQTNQSATGGNAEPSIIAFNQATVAGSLLVAIGRLIAGRTGVAFSDNQGGNVWTTVLIGNDVNAVDTYFGYALNTKGGTAATVSMAYSGAFVSNIMAIAEYPAASAKTLRTSATATAGATGTNPATPNIAPVAGDLLIGAWNLGGATAATTSAGVCGASANLAGQGRSAASFFDAFEDGIASTSTSQNATLNYSTSSTYAGAIFAFAPPASGGGQTGLQLAMDASLRNSGLRH